jgi:hypothetical protein
MTLIAAPRLGESTERMMWLRHDRGEPNSCT